MKKKKELHLHMPPAQAGCDQLAHRLFKMGKAAGQGNFLIQEEIGRAHV